MNSKNAAKRNVDKDVQSALCFLLTRFFQGYFITVFGLGKNLLFKPILGRCGLELKGKAYTNTTKSEVLMTIMISNRH